MGLGGTAVALLLAAFALGAASLLSEAFLGAQREVDEAHKAQAEGAMAARQGAIAAASKAYQAGPQTLELWVNNTGGQAFDAREVDVMLDGAYASGLVVARRVDNDPNTAVWAPGQQLYLKLDPVASNPARAWVVAGHGASAVV